MSSPDAGHAALEEILPDGLVSVGSYPTFAAASERGLVILAMGLPYWLVPSGDQFALLVESGGGVAVGHQLARFERESIGWPPAPISTADASPFDLLGPMFWALVVLIVYCFQPGHPRLAAWGALDAQALFSNHEWWRVGTALFLHADVGHLVSNTVSGVFVFAVVLSTIGRSRGWLLLLASSLAGNFIVAALRHAEAYVSIGASTAIFAGLGLLTGRSIRVAHRSTHPHRWRGMLVPLGAGATVLALYGAGGQRVDLGAHLCGFAAGLTFGVLEARAARAAVS